MSPHMQCLLIISSQHCLMHMLWRHFQLHQLHVPVPVTLNCAVLCCAVLCCAVLCCAVLCCAVLCCAVLCCAVLCCACKPSRHYTFLHQCVSCFFRGVSMTASLSPFKGLSSISLPHCARPVPLQTFKCIINDVGMILA